MSKAYFVVVGSQEAAEAFLRAEGLWATYQPLTIAQRADSYLLYGRSDLPYVVLPEGKKIKFDDLCGTLETHEQAGRIVPWTKTED